jgi:hypothetical protein
MLSIDQGSPIRQEEGCQDDNPERGAYYAEANQHSASGEPVCGPHLRVIQNVRAGKGSGVGTSGRDKGSSPSAKSARAGVPPSEVMESITWAGQPLCYIVRRELDPQRTTFVTPSELTLQVGYIVYQAAREIPRHVHRRVERAIDRTAEVLFVRTGRCELDVYNDDRERVATREVRQGDLIILVGGGHGFRVLEDTVLLEVKQGPYEGTDEKERF